MALHGWQVNLTGKEIIVYDDSKNFMQKGNQCGKLTKNECFSEGSVVGAPWEGDGSPVIFKNTSGNMIQGAVYDDYGNYDFANYASNGTSWVAVNDLKRKVVYTTRAYYADGSGDILLEPGSYVWLTQNCTRGQKNPNYVAVTKVQKANGSTITFTGNGFVDLTFGNRWLNVGSILLRKA